MQHQSVYFPLQNRNAWCIPPLRSQHLAPLIIIRDRWKDTWSSMIPKRQKLEKKNNQWCIFKNICMCYYPVACVKAAPVFSFTSTHKKVPSYWNLLFPWIISIFSPNPSTSALSTRAAACAQDITQEWVSQIPRKCWSKRDSFMLLMAVFLHPYFIDLCYEKRQIIFPDLFQSIVQIRKAQLHFSDQEILCAQENTFFPLL